jgi:peptidoglycan-associated lipoprotein
VARKRATLEEMVFFDYDISAIREDQRGRLDAKAGVLREESAVTLRIVGHADERGSTEYNLALGMRRAQSIRDYLAGFGISADRLQIQSMGEERPLNAGHDESAWSRNRRGEFQILTGLSGGR